MVEEEHSKPVNDATFTEAMRLLGESKSAFYQGEEGQSINLFIQAAKLEPGLYSVDNLEAEEPQLSLGEGTIDDFARYLGSPQFVQDMRILHGLDIS